MPSILVIGYGNPDREDDGVAWHILQKLATYYNRPISILDGGEFGGIARRGHLHLRSGASVDKSPTTFLRPVLVFVLQLTPEMAEPLAQFDFVCFVDAHTGAYSEEIRLAPIEPGYQMSPFTHHLTPESCLALAETLYAQAPQGLMVSVRGYQFGYRTELSGQTAMLADVAVERIINWVDQIDRTVA